jgi:hypothetical protein
MANMKSDLINGMKDISGLGDAAVEAAPAMASTEQCVPVDALAIPGEGEALEAPEIGDQVSYTVEGKVTRIEGKKAYVEPETVNGQPAKISPESEVQSPESGEAGAYAALEEEAGTMGAMA